MKNPYSKQVQSYERIPEPGNPRETEAWAMVQAAKRMALAIAHGDDHDLETKKVRRDAIRLNWRLWTIIQAELLRERSDLPPDLHGNMLSLCNFIDKHTVSTLVNPTAEALEVLIGVNRNIASGLMTDPEAATHAGVMAGAPAGMPSSSDARTDTKI